MKKFKNLNLTISMKTKKTLKNIFKISLGIGLLFPFLRSEPSQAFVTACSPNGTVADMSNEANPCFLTPEMLEVTFYEIGFCTSDPLASGTFDDSICTKSWENTSGYETDIGNQTFETMNGATYLVPNETYPYAYAIMNNSWKYKAQYDLSNGTTYYTNSANGLVTTNASSYGEWTDDISFMEGQEGTNLCYDFTASTTGGTVKAVLADSSLVSATDNTTCLNATRVIGSVALTTPLTMDDSVTGYRLTWQITNMGIGLNNNGGNAAVDWRGGPFTPSFSLID